MPALDCRNNAPSDLCTVLGMNIVDIYPVCSYTQAMMDLTAKLANSMLRVAEIRAIITAIDETDVVRKAKIRALHSALEAELALHRAQDAADRILVVEAREARSILAANLRAERKTRRLSQEALAALASLDRSYVSAVERSEHNISIDNIGKLAKALKVSVAALFRL